jgi:hypothetical protein
VRAASPEAGDDEVTAAPAHAIRPKLAKIDANSLKRSRTRPI